MHPHGYVRVCAPPPHPPLFLSRGARLGPQWSLGSPQGPGAWESGNTAPGGHEPLLPAGREPPPQASQGGVGCLLCLWAWETAYIIHFAALLAPIIYYCPVSLTQARHDGENSVPGRMGGCRGAGNSTHIAPGVTWFIAGGGDAAPWFGFAGEAVRPVCMVTVAESHGAGRRQEGLLGGWACSPLPGRILESSQKLGRSFLRLL